MGVGVDMVKVGEIAMGGVTVVVVVMVLGISWVVA
jgi:hypothetical protein